MTQNQVTTVPDYRLIPPLTHRQDLLALLTLVLHLQASCGVVADLLAHSAVIFTFWTHEGRKEQPEAHGTLEGGPPDTRSHLCSAPWSGQDAAWLFADVGFPCDSLRVPLWLFSGTGLPSHHLYLRRSLLPHSLSCVPAGTTACRSSFSSAGGRP